MRDLGLLVFFAAIGLAFLFIEIPLIQQFILFLDNPAYSITTVLFALLLFSGIGSRFSGYFSLNSTFVGLLPTLMITFILIPYVSIFGLGFPLALRIIFTVFLLAPVGFFMGIPLPNVVGSIQDTQKHLIPWAWSVNGTFSVVSSVAAALLALSFGFRLVYLFGTIIYLIAWLLVRAQGIQNQSQPQ